MCHNKSHITNKMVHPNECNSLVNFLVLKSTRIPSNQILFSSIKIPFFLHLCLYLEIISISNSLNGNPKLKFTKIFDTNDRVTQSIKVVLPFSSPRGDTLTIHNQLLSATNYSIHQLKLDSLETITRI
jgi:hypothetical protein